MIAVIPAEATTAVSGAMANGAMAAARTPAVAPATIVPISAPTPPYCASRNIVSTGTFISGNRNVARFLLRSMPCLPCIVEIIGYEMPNVTVFIASPDTIITVSSLLQPKVSSILA